MANPKEIPALVLYVLSVKLVSADLLDECLDKHPEYFPKEVAHRKKWHKIPYWVHESYQEKALIVHQEIEEKYPTPNKGKGFLWCAMNPEKIEPDPHEEIRQKERERRIEELSKLYYAPYLKQQ